MAWATSLLGRHKHELSDDALAAMISSLQVKSHKALSSEERIRAFHLPLQLLNPATASRVWLEEEVRQAFDGRPFKPT